MSVKNAITWSDPLMEERELTRGNLAELGYLLLVAAGAIYLFLINYVFEPISWREWFIARIPKELAALNLVVLMILYFCLTHFAHKFSLSVRYLFLVTTICLGSFLKASGQAVPLVAFGVFLILVVSHLIMQKRRRG